MGDIKHLLPLVTWLLSRCETCTFWDHDGIFGSSFPLLAYDVRQNLNFGCLCISPSVIPCTLTQTCYISQTRMEFRRVTKWSRSKRLVERQLVIILWQRVQSLLVVHLLVPWWCDVKCQCAWSLSVATGSLICRLHSCCHSRPKMIQYPCHSQQTFASSTSAVCSNSP